VERHLLPPHSDALAMCPGRGCYHRRFRRCRVRRRADDPRVGATQGSARRHLGHRRPRRGLRAGRGRSARRRRPGDRGHRRGVSRDERAVRLHSRRRPGADCLGPRPEPERRAVGERVRSASRDGTWSPSRMGCQTFAASAPRVAAGREPARDAQLSLATVPHERATARDTGHHPDDPPPPPADPKTVLEPGDLALFDLRIGSESLWSAGARCHGGSPPR
jgi:hypothetical protein